MVGDNKENSSGVICCFCKNSIKETKADPVSIDVTLNEEMINKPDSTQFFWAHYNCLGPKFHPEVPLLVPSDY